MILEGIVTTLSLEGVVNIAPMGPIVDEQMERLLLRPFRTAQTYRNLKAHGEGVLHVTDDVLLLSKAALGTVGQTLLDHDSVPHARQQNHAEQNHAEQSHELFPARKVRGQVLRDACRFYEFRVLKCDDSEERTRIEAEVVHQERLRDFFGFNRAKHAVIEAAILATRTDFLPLDDIEAEFRRLAVIVDKTGGEREAQAFAFLEEHVRAERRKRS
jgi:uncharacterized protein